MAPKETTFNKGNVKLHVYKVNAKSGQKWIHHFEVPIILFAVDLTLYDQFLDGNETLTQLQQSLLLLDSIINNSSWVIGSCVILFLNNVAAFEAKLNKIPLAAFFPDYSGGDDVNDVLAYIRKRFTSIKQKDNHLQIYVHKVCEDSVNNNVLLMFGSAKEAVLHFCIHSEDGAKLNKQQNTHAYFFQELERIKSKN